MGINTVAIYSDIDRNSKFVSMADSAYRVGPPPSLQSYLNDKKIIEIAKDSHCQAIHPGFGFLSENADFADTCKQNQIIFVGPPADAIRKMGSKSESKKIMTAANVPVVPGYHGDNQDKHLLLDEAKKIGFPVLIKAVSGGGGKGMRIVQDSQKFFELLESAQEESLNSFKDDRVLVEKYIQRPRHIEVQVFGDQHKNYVYLFERDCSIQRRHQKVVEEAPSNITAQLRKSIGQSAIAAAAAVSYYNAGTVEFIFDLTQNKYYFMEMNTRLQVEHPISELITGQDFVEWQLRVASGQELPIKDQSLLQINGHAIEARVYSEDPFAGFIPDSGPLKYYREPHNVEGVRVDSGVRQGDDISPYYDPMIAKLIMWGRTREEAINRLSQALSNYRILGLPTNLTFLRRVINHEDFRNQEYDTNFIQKNSEKLLHKDSHFQQKDLIAAVFAKIAHDAQSVPLPTDLLFFRANHQFKQTFKISVSAKHVETNTTEQTIEVTHLPRGKFDIALGKTLFQNVSYEYLKESNTIRLTTQDFVVEREFVPEEETVTIFDDQGDPITVTFENYLFKEKNEKSGARGSALSDPKMIKTPINCTLRKVLVKEGDIVKEGDQLIVMEVMKQHHAVYASQTLRVKKINYKVGDPVKSGELVLELEDI